jgi:transcriptional regulator GlxA family with amidase domain
MLRTDSLCRPVRSQRPGTSLEFALAVVAELFDEATAQMIAEQMLVPRRYD